MQLKDVKLGYVCFVYITENTADTIAGFIALGTTNKTILATVIVIDSHYGSVRLGWKKDEECPISASSNSGLVVASHQKALYRDRLAEYASGLWVDWTRPTAGFLGQSPRLPSPTLGHICSRNSCKRICPDAMHDATINPFICYECKLMDQMRK